MRYTVRVIAAQGSRELEAVAKLTGEPAAGVQVAAVSTQPTTIRLTGPQPALLALEDRVPTEPLDVTGWKESSAKVVPLALPEGVRAEPDEVTVTVTLTDRDPAR
ncbi:MAG TPA: hypothetical protein DCZ72_14415 [Armatimonadetes bacterium]|nr:hypothetical protein [Armatimonadota bacterium]